MREILKKVSEEFFNEFKGELKELERKGAKALGHLIAGVSIQLLVGFIDFLTAEEGKEEGERSAFDAIKNPDFQVRAPHHLSKAEAIGRMQNGLESAINEFGGEITDFRQQWTENGGMFSGRFKGRLLKAIVIVSDRDVVINGLLPLITFVPQSVLKRKVESILSKKISEILK